MSQTHKYHLFNEEPHELMVFVFFPGGTIRRPTPGLCWTHVKHPPESQTISGDSVLNTSSRNRMISPCDKLSKTPRVKGTRVRESLILGILKNHSLHVKIVQYSYYCCRLWPARACPLAGSLQHQANQKVCLAPLDARQQSSAISVLQKSTRYR